MAFNTKVPIYILYIQYIYIYMYIYVLYGGNLMDRKALIYIHNPKNTVFWDVVCVAEAIKISH